MERDRQTDRLRVKETSRNNFQLPPLIQSCTGPERAHWPTLQWQWHILYCRIVCVSARRQCHTLQHHHGIYHCYYYLFFNASCYMDSRMCEGSACLCFHLHWIRTEVSGLDRPSSLIKAKRGQFHTLSSVWQKLGVSHNLFVLSKEQ